MINLIENKTTLLMEKLDLLESDPFKAKGYKMDGHITLSPNQKAEILTKGNKIYGPRRFRFSEGKRRIITIYKHKDEHYGHIEHQGPHGHPMDSNLYKLKLKAKKKKTKK